MYKLVIHINDINKWDMLFANISNFDNELDGKDYLLSVVVNGIAVEGILNDDILSKIGNLYYPNLTINICANSLRGRNINEKLVPTSFNIVKTSVFEITRLQNELKYAYIKL